MKDKYMRASGTGFSSQAAEYKVSGKARNQAHAFLSNYTSDVSGVCSALYELGGMVVMHDPSGCNSTYNTHDEPRWYDKDSLIFISGLSQIDAIMGNDDKLIDDVVRAARDLKPAFIALVRTPIPMMTGTDFDAIARIVEMETGIPTWYFPTSGMNSYVRGAGMAMEKAARCLVDEPGETTKAGKDRKDQPFRVNVLGATPLDFSINTSISSLKEWLFDHGFGIQSLFTMGDCPSGEMLRQIRSADLADVSLVVSSVGLPAARVLKERFGIPYVTGFPCGAFGSLLLEALHGACLTGQDQNQLLREQAGGADADLAGNYIIGEPVTALSLAAAFRLEWGVRFQVICPLEPDIDLAGAGCLCISSEADLMKILEGGQRIVADPIFRRICPAEAEFIPLPHEAYSGRIYRGLIPDLVRDSRKLTRNMK